MGRYFGHTIEVSGLKLSSRLLLKKNNCNIVNLPSSCFISYLLLIGHNILTGCSDPKQKLITPRF